MAKYKIADVVLDGKFLYRYTAKLCENYLYDGDEPAELTIESTQADIDAEKAVGGAEGFPDAYLESLAVFRKLCAYILMEKQGIIFHCSALAVDGKAYLFTAPSGTGKSTHARMWREVYKDRVIMVNDDKPIIRYIDGEFYVYGTPWNGKHHLDTNCRVKIDAVCHLVRGEKNFIEEIPAGEMLGVVINQTLLPKTVTEMDKWVFLLDKFLRKVRLYRLHCNISEDAARVAYETLVGNGNANEKNQ